jgi:hypothetical protein
MVVAIVKGGREDAMLLPPSTATTVNNTAIGAIGSIPPPPLLTTTAIALVGKSARNSVGFCDYSNSGPFELRNCHRNFIFPIMKFVPANL